jgi:hypothetical protein
MFKGFKKKYSKQEYIKIFLSSDGDTCTFCYYNKENYLLDNSSAMTSNGLEYFKTVCKQCKRQFKSKTSPIDRFEPLYD